MMALDPGVTCSAPGRYKVTIYAGKDRDGKQRQRSRSFAATSDRAANKAADAVRVQMRAELVGLRPDMHTVAGFVAQWLANNEAEKSPTTMKGYRIVCTRIVDRWGHLRLNELTTPMVRAWYTELKQAGMTPATLKHQHAVLRAVMRSAVADELIARPPTFGVKLPKDPDRELKLPRDADMVRLVNSMAGDLAIAVRLAAVAGLRRGELVALRWSDIQGRDVSVSKVLIEAHGQVMARDMTKGKKDRRVALDDATMRALVRHRQLQADQAHQLRGVLAPAAERAVLANMAADPTGRTPYSPTWLSHSWQQARGDMPVRLHDLRHWYATKVLESGEATVAELSQWLGHAQVSTTMNIYVHANPERRRVSARIMGRALG